MPGQEAFVRGYARRLLQAAGDRAFSLAFLPDSVQRAPAGPVLRFAPERVILDRLARLNLPVETTDLLSADVDRPGEDIQRLSFRDARFGTTLCNHVLVHVDRALAEGASAGAGRDRPVHLPGDFFRPRTRTYARPDDNGHYRHYGLDVVERRKQAFAEAEVIDRSIVADP